MQLKLCHSGHLFLFVISTFLFERCICTLSGETTFKFLPPFLASAKSEMKEFGMIFSLWDKTPLTKVYLILRRKKEVIKMFLFV